MIELGTWLTAVDENHLDDGLDGDGTKMRNAYIASHTPLCSLEASQVCRRVSVFVHACMCFDLTCQAKDKYIAQVISNMHCITY